MKTIEELYNEGIVNEVAQSLVKSRKCLILLDFRYIYLLFCLV